MVVEVGKHLFFFLLLSLKLPETLSYEESIGAQKENTMQLVVLTRVRGTPLYGLQRDMSLGWTGYGFLPL